LVGWWLWDYYFIFFDTGHMIVNIGWVGYYYYKAWTMQMEFGTVHGFSSAIVREEHPARGVDGHKFFQPKKNPNFFSKKIRVEYGKGKCNHIQTCGHMRSGPS
jgi:hypothetical protein